MNGAEHYAEAERLLAAADERHTVGVGDPWASKPEVQPVHSSVERAEMRAVAQVHATLALAAATAEGVESPIYGPLVQRALPAGAAYEGSPEQPGNDWGRVLR